MPRAVVRSVAANVLVADDDPLMLGLVASALAPLGSVTTVEDGDELLQAIANRPFDLVVTDVSMPWMTGLYVACSARRAGLHMPIIVMTATPITTESLDYIGGDTVLLRKPFLTEQLVSLANQLLARPRG